MHPKDETQALDRLSVMTGLSMVSRRAQHAYALMADGKTDAAIEVIASIEAELAYIRAKLREGGVIP